jgi:hypothetical protein
MKPFPEPNVCDFSPWTGCAPLHIETWQGINKLKTSTRIDEKKGFFWFPRAGVGTQSGRASVPCEQAAASAP